MIDSTSLISRLIKFFNSVTPFSKIIAVVLFITSPFIGFYIGMEYQREINTSNYLKSQIISSKIKIIPTISPTPTALANPTPTIELSEFQKFLKEKCFNQEILMGDLPFNFSVDLIDKYKIKDQIYCHYDEPSVSRHLELFTMPRGNEEILIGDKFSQESGWLSINLDYEKGRSNYQSPKLIESNNTKTLVNLLPSDPCCWSDMLLSIDIRTFYSLGDYKILKRSYYDYKPEGKALDLIKKYGEPSSIGQVCRFPNYTVCSGSAEFHTEFLNTYFPDYENTNPIFKSIIDRNIKDVKGITLKP